MRNLSAAQISLDLEDVSQAQAVPSLKLLRSSAETAICKVLMGVLPPGVPPSFRKIIRARFVDKKRLVAELEMVDGQLAEVEAWRWGSSIAGGESWAHRWLRLDGGDLSWEIDHWQRFPAEGAAE